MLNPDIAEGKTNFKVSVIVSEQTVIVVRRVVLTEVIATLTNKLESVKSILAKI